MPAHAETYRGIAQGGSRLSMVDSRGLQSFVKASVTLAASTFDAAFGQAVRILGQNVNLAETVVYAAVSGGSAREGCQLK